MRHKDTGKTGKGQDADHNAHFQGVTLKLSGRSLMGYFTRKKVVWSDRVRRDDAGGRRGEYPWQVSTVNSGGSRDRSGIQNVSVAGQKERLQGKISKLFFFLAFSLCFLPNGGVAEERERLRSASEAGIASFFRWNGCVGDAALRGSDQIGVGRDDYSFPLPPNRTGGFPAYGSPVDGFTSKRIADSIHGLQPLRKAPVC